MASNQYYGPILGQESRMTLKWVSLDTANPNYDSDFPGPGGTKDTQWVLGTNKIRLYEITSTPWHNMQDVSFLCEFDRSTNLAPDPGGNDPSETPETDPQEFIGPDENYAVFYQVADSGSAAATSTFDLGTIKRHIDDTIQVFNDGTLEPTTDTTSGLYLQQYWLRIMNSGSNQGYYPIVTNTANSLTIDPLGTYGELTTEGNLNARVYRFQRGDGTNLFNSKIDIQTDLQSGRFFAYVFVHAWPSLQTGSVTQDSLLHTFKITPYYLTASELNENSIVPSWSFKCKSVVQEYDQKIGSTIYGAFFENYWGNLPL